MSILEIVAKAETFVNLLPTVVTALKRLDELVPDGTTLDDRLKMVEDFLTKVHDEATEASSTVADVFPKVAAFITKFKSVFGIK